LISHEVPFSHSDLHKLSIDFTNISINGSEIGTFDATSTSSAKNGTKTRQIRYQRINNIHSEGNFTSVEHGSDGEFRQGNETDDVLRSKLTGDSEDLFVVDPRAIGGVDSDGIRIVLREGNRLRGDLESLNLTADADFVCCVDWRKSSNDARNFERNSFIRDEESILESLHLCERENSVQSHKVDAADVKSGEVVLPCGAVVELDVDFSRQGMRRDWSRGVVPNVEDHFGFAGSWVERHWDVGRVQNRKLRTVIRTTIDSDSFHLWLELQESAERKEINTKRESLSISLENELTLFRAETDERLIISGECKFALKNRIRDESFVELTPIRKDGETEGDGARNDHLKRSGNIQDSCVVEEGDGVGGEEADGVGFSFRKRDKWICGIHSRFPNRNIDIDADGSVDFRFVLRRDPNRIPFENETTIFPES